ncbi:ATP-binding protein [Roseicella frigidaeris]|nr:ATP-binding protein [Roseicella frigidaeris]
MALLFRQTPIAVAVTAVNALLMTALLLHAGEPRAPAWMLLVLAVAAARLLLARAWRRAAPAGRQVARWDLLGTLAVGAAGLAWGCGAVWLWPPTAAANRLVWTFLIGGMCAGASGLYHAHLPATLAFLLGAGLPLIGRYAAEGTAEGGIAAAMILVFLGALAFSVWRSSQDFAAHVRLRLDLARQARTLDAMTLKLREAVARHHGAEASLRQAQKMEAVGQLTGGIAHDFNNLLTAVLGSLALLRKHLPPGDERMARLLDNAWQGAQRGAALTQRLLAFGRRQTLEPTAVSLPQLVRDMTPLLQSALGGGARLRSDFPPALPPVLVDANQLELALLNLVANARDAMPEGGEIQVSAAEQTVPPGEAGGLPPGNYVALRVADAGEGMDEATLARAIEPFFTTKGLGKGTGLGLSMVHGLAAQSGGRFLLRSARGEGTVAELWLPRAEASAPPLPDEPPPGPAGRSGHVLLVDDDPLVLRSTAAMLEDLGHAVTEAGSGEAALAQLAAGIPVDLLITDQAMPGMTGLQLIEAARRQRPGLPVLLATGYAELEGGMPPGLARLGKPFAQERLAAAVAERLGGDRPDPMPG